MKEIRIHGRGGQGAVTTSQLIALAAFHDGKYCQAFPNFGVERRGAPVMAFARVADKKINLRQHIYNPDYVIVLDASLIGTVDVAEGLKDDGMLIVNTDKKAEELGITGNFKIKTIDITKVAMEVIGKPFVNTGILGAFAAFTKEVSFESLKKALNEKFKEKPKVAELNIKAIERIVQETGE